jgi:hypothetical protein
VPAAGRHPRHAEGPPRRRRSSASGRCCLLVHDLAAKDTRQAELLTGRQRPGSVTSGCDHGSQGH